MADGSVNLKAITFKEQFTPSNILKACVVLLILVALGYNIYRTHEINSMQQTIYNLQLQNQAQINQKFIDLANKERDTVSYYNTVIKNYGNQANEEDTSVENTNQPDSLISLYYKYRALTSINSIPRF